MPRTRTALFTLAALLALACLPSLTGCGDGSNSIGEGIADAAGSHASMIVVVPDDVLDDGHFGIAREFAVAIGAIDRDEPAVEIMCVPARQTVDGFDAWDCGVYVQQASGVERTGPHAYVRFESSPDPRIDSRHRDCDDVVDEPLSALHDRPDLPRYLASLHPSDGLKQPFDVG